MCTYIYIYIYVVFRHERFRAEARWRRVQACSLFLDIINDIMCIIISIIIIIIISSSSSSSSSIVMVIVIVIVMVIAWIRVVAEGRHCCGRRKALLSRCTLAAALSDTPAARPCDQR